MLQRVKQLWPLLGRPHKVEWAQHVQDLRQGYGPVDAAEEKLVTAIAVAMWNEIRADRTLVETMAEIPPRRAGPLPRHEPAGAGERSFAGHGASAT